MSAIKLFYVFLIFKTVSGSMDTMYNNCGTTKLCFGAPAGCVSDQSCQVLATAQSYRVSVDVAGMQFETYSMRGFDWDTASYTEPHFVSLGFSFDDQIGSDTMIDFVSAYPYRTMDMYSSFVTKDEPVREPIDSVTYLRVIEAFADYYDLYAMYRTPYKISVAGITYDFQEDDFYLIIQAGSSVKENNVGQPNILEPTFSEGSLNIFTNHTILNPKPVQN